MKLIIDIDDNVFTRLFDNGVDTSSEDRKVIDRAVRNGIPYEERPQGHWVAIKNKNGTILAYSCSECEYNPYHAKISDYCPNCGAKMVNEGENE